MPAFFAHCYVRRSLHYPQGIISLRKAMREELLRGKGNLFELIRASGSTALLTGTLEWLLFNSGSPAIVTLDSALLRRTSLYGIVQRALAFRVEILAPVAKRDVEEHIRVWKDRRPGITPGAGKLVLAYVVRITEEEDDIRRLVRAAAVAVACPGVSEEQKTLVYKTLVRIVDAVRQARTEDTRKARGLLRAFASFFRSRFKDAGARRILDGKQLAALSKRAISVFWPLTIDKPLNEAAYAALAPLKTQPVARLLFDRAVDERTYGSYSFGSLNHHKPECLREEAKRCCSAALENWAVSYPRDDKGKRYHPVRGEGLYQRNRFLVTFMAYLEEYDLVKSALAHPNPRWRKIALQALGCHPPEDYWDILEKVATSDDDRGVREDAMRTLKNAKRAKDSSGKP